ncbi:IclR family transcriptional regulator [Hornefia butyriciproducens]|uniref:IclR family transcriptional regulator n=1 Tax=Hornefia butyriciproducens TaxID=2652293 RepID=UPI003D064538
MNEKNNVTAVERTILLIRAISLSPEPVGVTELSKQTGIPKPTVSRFCVTLTNLGMLDRNEQDEYSLGLIFIALGERVKASRNSAEIAQPYIDKLAKDIGESINLGICNEDTVYTIYNVSGESSVLVSKLVPISPLYCSSLGKIFLMHRSKDEIISFFDQELPKRTIYTQTTYEDYLNWKQEYDKTGVTTETEEYEYGLSCIAAPLYDHEKKLIAAISLSAPTSRLELKGRKELAQKLKETASEISAIYDKLYIRRKDISG